MSDVGLQLVAILAELLLQQLCLTLCCCAADTQIEFVTLCSEPVTLCLFTVTRWSGSGGVEV